MLRETLIPQTPKTETVDELSKIIALIEEAFETKSPTEELMVIHNRLAQRDDIDAQRYEKLYSSMSCKDAALEALMPVATKVADLSREELEDVAKRILEPKNDYETNYFLKLFELNTNSGNSDLFFWPDEHWLKELNTKSPSPAQIVDKASEQSDIIRL